MLSVVQQFGWKDVLLFHGVREGKRELRLLSLEGSTRHNLDRFRLQRHKWLTHGLGPWREAVEGGSGEQELAENRDSE